MFIYIYLFFRFEHVHFYQFLPYYYTVIISDANIFDSEDDYGSFGITLQEYL